MNAGRRRRHSRDHTVDAFLGGLVTLVQPRKGHRAGLDAALLQALVPAERRGPGHRSRRGRRHGRLLPRGARVRLSVVGIERDPGLVACGAEALTLPENARFAGARSPRRGDDRRIAAIAARRLAIAEDADWVLMNPPFDREAIGAPSPDVRPARRAHGGGRDCSNPGVARRRAAEAAAACSASIHRAEALPEMLDALAGRFGAMPHPACASRRSRGGDPHSRHGAARQPRAACQLLPGAHASSAGRRLDAAGRRDPAR